MNIDTKAQVVYKMLYEIETYQKKPLMYKVLSETETF